MFIEDLHLAADDHGQTAMPLDLPDDEGASRVETLAAVEPVDEDIRDGALDLVVGLHHLLEGEDGPPDHGGVLGLHDLLEGGDVALVGADVHRGTFFTVNGQPPSW